MTPGFLEILNQRGVKYIHTPLADGCIRLMTITSRHYWNKADLLKIERTAFELNYRRPRRHGDTLRITPRGVKWPAPDYNANAQKQRDDRGLCMVRVTVPASRKTEIIEIAREMRLGRK